MSEQLSRKISMEAGQVEQFVQSIHIAVMMQLDMFVDKRMKILYTLAFM